MNEPASMKQAKAEQTTADSVTMEQTAADSATEGQSLVSEHELSQFPSLLLYGVRISQMGFADTITWLVNAIVERRTAHVVTVNPIMLMSALKDSGFMGMMRRAELVVPDGTGVVWAARHIGQPVKEKVAGIELMQKLIEVGDARGWRIFLLGATHEIIQAAAESLNKQYHGIQIVGVRDGFFTSAEDAQVIAQIREAAPDMLFVGRSQALQDPWIDQYKSQLQVPIMMGVGGSFDILSGKLKRAPKLFIRFHLEWFYRLLQEPWRYRRMLALPQFVILIWKNKGRNKKT